MRMRMTFRYNGRIMRISMNGWWDKSIRCRRISIISRCNNIISMSRRKNDIIDRQGKNIIICGSRGFKRENMFIKNNILTNKIVCDCKL